MFQRDDGILTQCHALVSICVSQMTKAFEQNQLNLGNVIHRLEELCRRFRTI